MDDYKLTWVEKKTYKVMYNTIEKLLKVCYEIARDNFVYISESEVVSEISYEKFCNLVNERLKGN